MKIKLAFVTFILAACSTLTFAQQKPNYGATPQDSVTCVENLSIYKDPYYTNGQYDEAVKYWRKAFNVCPASSKNLYIHGVKMYKKFAKGAADKETKLAYVDTLMLIYDQRIVNFGEEGKVRGRKGADLLIYKKKADEAFVELDKSLQMEGNKIEPHILAYHYKCIGYLVKQKKKTNQDLLEAFPIAMEIVDYNLAKTSSEQAIKAWENTKASLEKGFVEAATCEDLIAFYQPKYDATPEDSTLLKNIVKFLGKFEDEGCTGQKLYEDAASSLCGIKPSYDCSMALGKLLFQKESYSDAASYFKAATEFAKTDEEKLDAYMKAAQASFNKKAFSDVRTYARKVIEINPNSGTAYMLIGDAYAATAGQCGDNECSKKSAYWAAVDKYYKAKSVDESVAEAANKRIGTYSGQFPKKSDCFFHSINEGDSFTVGCWINETTKVRVRD